MRNFPVWEVPSVLNVPAVVLPILRDGGILINSYLIEIWEFVIRIVPCNHLSFQNLMLEPFPNLKEVFRERIHYKASWCISMAQLQAVFLINWCTGSESHDLHLAPLSIMCSFLGNIFTVPSWACICYGYWDFWYLTPRPLHLIKYPFNCTILYCSHLLLHFMYGRNDLLSKVS